MEIAPAATTPVAQGHKATLFVALELSKATWLVGMHSPLADKISQHRLPGGDVEALLALITRLREQAEATLGQPVAVVCCYEAGYDGFWLHRWLQAHRITNHVLDAASVLVDRRARRAKTDRLDLVSLLRTVMAWYRGEHQVCRMVRVPSPEQEDRRRQTRERERLVNERVQHLGRIKGLLMTQGIRDFEPTRRDWQNRLDQLRTGDGRVLAPCLKAEIKRECQRLWLVMEMIAAVEAERDAPLQDDAAQPTAGAADPTSQLLRLKGVGATIAGVLVREVFYRAFANRRQVASYLGLTPSPWCSGAVSRDQGISKAGNPRARQVAIELAWLWLRHQPASALAQWFHQRSGTTKGRLRRILVVALARKLVVALWRYLTDGVVPEGAITKA